MSLKSLFFLLFFTSLISYGQLSPEQEEEITLLQKEIAEATHDSTVIKAWKKWDDIIYPFDPNLDFDLNRRIDSLAGVNLKKELSETERQFFLNRKAQALNILAGVSNHKGDMLAAQKYSIECLKIREELGDPIGIAGALNGLSIFYNTQKEYHTAITYLDSAANIYIEHENLDGTAMCYNNLGLAYMELASYDSAMFYFDECINIYNEINAGPKYAAIYNNQGLIYKDLGEHEKAIEHFQLSVKNCEEFGNFSVLANSLNNIATTLQLQNKYAPSISFAKRASEIGVSYGMIGILSESYRLQYLAHKNLNNKGKALDAFENFIAYQDTLEDENDRKEMLDQKYAFEYGLKSAKDSIAAAEAVKVKEAELLAEKAESSKRKQQSYILYAGLALALLLGGFILNRLKISQRQKKLIAEQKETVDLAYATLEVKNKEITDSITYAKRIQSAILPSSQKVNTLLPDNFILYIPKDIVAGDFYWMDKIENKILFAACDCTGHGVPGAMVSVVCNNGLNRSIKEFGLSDPGEIIDKTRELIIEEFEKSDDEVKDGMDMALCSLEGSTLKYAGAHNPLWIIRKNSNEIEEIKGDKQPVGVFDNPSDFTSHELQVNKGDSVYIFTDGYTDQFGGNKGKKLKAANFKKLILSVQGKPMTEQKRIILEAFNNWKGSLEQLDDVCIIGVTV